MFQLKTERRTLSFVLRLWLESVDESDVVHSRGQLEAVTSGETIHFSDLSEMVAILNEQVDQARDDLKN